MTLPQEYATISIIGPTNVGKSSILATLGNLAGIHRPVIEVIPGTDPTKHHSPDEAYSFTDRLMVSPFTPYLKIQDSWGFQKSSEILEQLSEQLRKQKLPITLNAILDYTKLRSEKETDPRNPYYQDLKAWEAVENCDIVLYVIDATHEPSTDRLAVDSLELLRSCERPVIAAFNFYSAEMQSVGTYVPEWKKVRKSKNVFHVCDYDALHRSFAEEIKLLQIAASLKGGMVLNQTQSDRIHESIRQRKGKENKRIAQ